MGGLASKQAIFFILDHTVSLNCEDMTSGRCISLVTTSSSSQAMNLRFTNTPPPHFLTCYCTHLSQQDDVEMPYTSLAFFRKTLGFFNIRNADAQGTWIDANGVK